MPRKGRRHLVGRGAKYEQQHREEALRELQQQLRRERQVGASNPNGAAPDRHDTTGDGSQGEASGA
jgi:hypothetical protein